MTASAPVTAPPAIQPKRPIWLAILAALYVLLGVVTAIPQLYYIFYYANLVTASPHANLLGQIWYWYGTQVDTGALSKDSGTMAGALLDAFFLGPLYIVTGIGLWGLRAWVRQVGLLTAGGAFYAILYFIFTYTLDHLHSVTNLLVFWATTLPYLALPIWLLATLLAGRDLFAPREGDT
jgi:hypothetical protein